MIHHWIVSLICIFSLQIHAAPMQPQHIEPLPAEGVLTAQFKQIRYIKGMSNPLITKGKITFWKGHGLIWQTNTPFPSIIVITPQGVSHVEQNQVMMIQAYPQESFFALISNLLSGDKITLPEGFKRVFHSDSYDGWSQKFIVTQEEFKHLFSSITFKGETHLTHMTIERDTGDKDEITFFDHRVSASDALTQHERSWLRND